MELQTDVLSHSSSHCKGTLVISGCLIIKLQTTIATNALAMLDALRTYQCSPPIWSIQRANKLLKMKLKHSGRVES